MTRGATLVSGFPVPSRESGLYGAHVALSPTTATGCLHFCRPEIGGKTTTTTTVFFMVVRLRWFLNVTLSGDGLFR